MSDQFLAEIRIFPVDKIPKEFMPCDGQLLAISQNTALFLLLSTTFGGNGQTTFGLPDMRGMAAVGAGVGLIPIELGEPGGAESVTLAAKDIPSHTHSAMARKEGTVDKASGELWANRPGRPVPNFYTSNGDKPANMHEKAISTEGGNAAHNNLMPYTGFIFCIATEGFFPERG